MRMLMLVTIGLVLVCIVIAAPLSAAGSPDPQNPQQDSDPRPVFRRILRGPGSSLGATARDLTAAELDGQSVLNGVWIEEVRPNSPASRAELQEGDVVIEFDDERVQHAQQFEILVRDTQPGWTVEATIVRDGIEREVSLTMVPERE